MAAPNYVFTRDFVDNNRINLQHYIWVELFGYHVHPQIPVSFPGIRLADIGTGTAIWLTDLSRSLPDAQLEGLDVSFNAATPPGLLPANVVLRQWNVKEAVPDELVGRYDVVHIRNFVFVLLDAEIPQALQRLVKLLKPGGHLQWGEPDMSSWRIETARPNMDTPALSELMTISQPQDQRLSPTWVSRLPELFAAAGLSVVESDVREAPQALAHAMHECALQIHDLLARATKNESVRRNLAEIMPKVLEETRQGAFWAFTRWTVVGKKTE